MRTVTAVVYKQPGGGVGDELGPDHPGMVIFFNGARRGRGWAQANGHSVKGRGGWGLPKLLNCVDTTGRLDLMLLLPHLGDASGNYTFLLVGGPYQMIRLQGMRYRGSGQPHQSSQSPLV